MRVPPSIWLRVTLPVVTITLTFAARVSGVSQHFSMLGDQIRDWSIALGPVTSLPLVGPATHVGGYTIGPAFYWILWLIRVVVGPWFQNLPHSGGIGQALLQSGVDALFLMAVWKRTGSVWLALAAVVLLATAPFDLALAATVWNPVVGSILAKAAVALILLDWPRGSLARVGITVAVAWSAVHAYTGAIFVALSIFAALVVNECLRRDWRAVWQRGLVIIGVVGALQIPYAIHQFSNRFSDAAMGAVTHSIAEVMSGREGLRLTRSASYYVEALTSIQRSTWPVTVSAWILLGCGAIAAIWYRRDPVLLSVILLPQLAAILGYAIWLRDLDSYYYLSLMPAAVLTVLIGATALLPVRVAQTVSIAILIAVLMIVPARVRLATTMFRMPEYRALVSGSQEIVKRRQPMRSIEAAFELSPTSDEEFVFRILGGRIDRLAEWRAVILPDGRVTYFPSSADGPGDSSECGVEAPVPDPGIERMWNDFKATGVDLTTLDGAGQFVEYVIANTGPEYGHITKSGAQTKYNNHAVDAMYYRSPTPLYNGGFYQVIDFIINTGIAAARPGWQPVCAPDLGNPPSNWGGKG